MKTYKRAFIKREDKVYCDVCGGLCTQDNFGSEYASLEASWGYASRSDGTKYNIQICETCFYDVITWMKERRLGKSVETPSPDPFEGDSNF